MYLIQWFRGRLNNSGNVYVISMCEKTRAKYCSRSSRFKCLPRLSPLQTDGGSCGDSARDETLSPTSRPLSLPSMSPLWGSGLQTSGQGWQRLSIHSTTEQQTLAGS